MGYYESMLEWEQELKEQQELAYIDLCEEAYSDGWNAERFTESQLKPCVYLQEYMRGYNARKAFEAVKAQHSPEIYFDDEWAYHEEEESLPF